MVTLAAGHYTMGSPADEEGRFDDEGPQHEVVIAAPFAVGKYEVTREQFSRFVAESGYSASAECRWWSGDRWKTDDAHNWRDPGFAQTPNDPVVCVTWNDASAYARWLAAKTGKGYRLLSEAEWEYATRAGATTARPWGSALSRDAANYGTDDCCQPSDRRPSGWRGFLAVMHDWLIGSTPAESAVSEGGRDKWGHTAPAGSFPPNGFGLHDMIGNVWEWTADCWNEGYATAPADGSAWLSGDCKRRVIRGGSWWSDPRRARSAMRFAFGVDVNRTKVGFRVARTPST